MASSVIDSTFNRTTSGNNTLAVPSNASGDLLLAIFAVKNAPSDWTYSTNTNDWALVWNGYASNVSFAVYARIAGASEPASYTFTVPGGAPTAAAMLSIRDSSGIPYGIRIEATADAVSTFDALFTGWDAPEADTLLLRCAGVQEDGPFNSTPAGYTMHENDGGGGIALAVASKLVGAGTEAAVQFDGPFNQIPACLQVGIYPATRGSWVGFEDRQNNGGSGTTFSMKIPATAQTGDLLLAVGGGSIDNGNLPAGWAVLSGFGYYKIAEAADPGSSVTWTRTTGGGWGAFASHAFRNMALGANTRSDSVGGGPGAVSISAGALTADENGWRFFRGAAEWSLNSGAYGVAFPAAALGGDNYGTCSALALYPVDAGSDPGGTFAVDAGWGSNWGLSSAMVEAVSVSAGHRNPLAGPFARPMIGLAR